MPKSSGKIIVRKGITNDVGQYKAVCISIQDRLPRANSQVKVGDNNPEVAKCVSPSPDNGLYGNVCTNTIHSGRQGKQLNPKDPHANESYAGGHISADYKAENGFVGQTK